MQLMGRSDLFLKLEIIKKVIGLTLLFITMRISVMAMAYSLLISGLLSQIINSWPNMKLLDYGYLEQLKDILPAILLAVVMGIIVYCVSLIGLNASLTLIIQIPLGAIIYIAGSKLFKLESYEYLINIIKGIAKK